MNRWMDEEGERGEVIQTTTDKILVCSQGFCPCEQGQVDLLHYLRSTALNGQRQLCFVSLFLCFLVCFHIEKKMH